MLWELEQGYIWEDDLSTCLLLALTQLNGLHCYAIALSFLLQVKFPELEYWTELFKPLEKFSLVL